MTDKADTLPDFIAGVSSHDLQEGQILSGKVGGEDAIMVRQGDEFFCLAAKCTHLGAPMAQGTLVEGTLRCPWHHARFCAKTGAVDNPPALHALRRWATETRAGKVFALQDAPNKARPKGPASAVARLVIIGGGGAAAGALRALSDQGYDGQITIVSRESQGPYDRTACSKMALVQGKAAPQLFVPEDLANLAIQWRTQTEAESLEVARREVVLRGGERLGYDVCLLATGSTPRRLPIPGAEATHVHTLRSSADCEAIAAAAPKGSQVVLVGASFIALEAAAALQQRGVQVHVVAPSKVPLATVLGEDMGRWVQQLHESKGVKFTLGAKVQKIEAKQVALEGGRSIPADAVVLGVGVDPNVALAKAAGLQLENGVVCAETLKTSAPGVYAAGDIANLPDPVTGRRIRVEHWAVAQKQGMVAARHMLGENIAYRQPPFFWTRHYTTSIAYVGHAQSARQVRFLGDLQAGKAAVMIYEGERVAAVATVGAPMASLAAEAALESGRMQQLAATLEPLLATH